MPTPVVSPTQLLPLCTLYVCFLAWTTRKFSPLSPILPMARPKPKSKPKAPKAPDASKVIKASQERRKSDYPYNQKYTIPFARKLSPAEQTQVDYYRALRERFHDGPFYSVLDASSSNAKKGSAARANFDPFHGMPTYSGRYQKKRRTLPRIAGQEYCKFHMRTWAYGGT